MNILLSHNHFGQYLIRYMIEHIAGKKTTGINETPSDDSVLTVSRRFNAHQQDKLIMLVRSYKEVFLITCNFLHVKDEKIRDVFNKYYLDYLELLKKYKESDCNKIEVYYEKLIENKDEELERVFNFLNLKEYNENISNKNIDLLYNNCLDSYRKRCPYEEFPSDVNKIPKDIRMEMDNVMMYEDPMLFSDYLTQYMEK